MTFADRFAWVRGRRRGKREIEDGIQISGSSNWMKTSFAEIKETGRNSLGCFELAKFRLLMCFCMEMSGRQSHAEEISVRRVDLEVFSI